MAMVNEGEGGLNAADNNHFNMVSSRIKEGDYMYVEYGHNHKSDGASGYKTYLDKYYNVAHNAGAKLIIVSPIERINTWDSTTNTYQHSLRDFATTGAEYVSEKIAAGATDIAFVDLNQYSLDFYNKIVADNDNNSGAIKFYFQTANGGSTDQTHPNDAGAENLAYEFFKAAKAVTDETQQAVLAGFLNDMTDETPNLVPTSITSLGAAPNSAWPIYTSPVSYPYPVVIEDVNFDESGVLTSVDVKVQPSDIVMDSYGIIVVTVYNEDGTEKGKIYAKAQVDNSTGNGPQTITEFTTGVTLGENDTYTAIVMKAKDAGDDTGLIVDEDANLAYSATYKPSEIEKILITNEDNDGAEDFDYYGATYDGDEPSSLSGFNGWTAYGSAGMTLTLGEDSDTKYATIKSDGAKNGTANQGSFYVAKDLTEAIGTSGRYMVSADIKYVSGGGMVTRFVTGNTSSKPAGTASIDLFTVGSNGVVTAGGTEIGSISATDFTNVTYTLDMDYGKAYVSVGGSDEKEISIANYDTKSTTITPETLTAFMFGGDKVAFDVQVENLTVAKLKDQTLPTYTVLAVPNDEAKGTVTLTYPTPEVTAAPTATTEVPTSTETTEGTTPTATTEVPTSTETAEVPTSTETTEGTTPTATTEVPTSTETTEGTTPTEVSTSTETTEGTTPMATTEVQEGAESQANTLEVDSTPNVTLSYRVGEAVITSDTDTSAVLIEAVYDEAGVIESVKSTPVTLEANKEKTVAASVGSKLMLWTSLEKMVPLTSTVEATLDGPSAELTMNTVVTVSAVANEGYVFMGWKDLDGKAVSSDAEYSFRLREDEVLVANFVKEPGVDDVTNFSLAAASANIKGVSGSTTTMQIVNPVDAAGTPLSKVSNTDATWSCSETGVSVSANGVVTLGDDFTIDANTTKTIAIKATLNGIEKTYNLTVYSYAYYENMADGATNYDGTFMTIAGKTAIVFPGASTTQTYTMSEPVTLDKATTITISNTWSGSNTCGQSRTLEFIDSSGNKVFSAYYTWTTLVVNSTELGNAISKDTWSDVKFEIDPTEGTVTVTVGSNTATTTLATGAANIAGIKFVSAASVPDPSARALGLSNITITQ
jgi:hypothetical protein